MRPFLLATLFACGTPAPKQVFCSTPCGLHIAANQQPKFACEDYIAVENAMLRDDAILPHSCETWKGAIAWEMSGESSVLNGRKVAGWAECDNRRFMFHVGGELRTGVTMTAFVHEALHLAQHCESPPPIDEGQDWQHSNWTRDGLSDMSQRVRRELERR